MSRKKWVYEEGIVLLEETSSTATKGAISTKAADEKLHVYLDGADRSVLTEDQTQTVTNKSVDADNNTISNLEVDNLKSGVLNTSTTLAGASNTQLPSALAVKTYVDDKTAAQNEASEISYDNAVSGLSATNVQNAIDEVDANVTTVQSNLTAHIDNTTDAHDASAISNVPAGTISSTNVQSAINELDGDIQAHINDATDAHDASAISTTPISGVTGTDVQAMLSDLKTQIDTKGTGNGDVSGAISSTDNAIARFDGTTGKIIQNSTVTLSDTGVVAGLSLDADTNTVTNIEDADIKSGANISRAKLASGTAYRLLANNSSGVMSENAPLTSTRVPFADANGQLTDASDFTATTNAITLANTKHLEMQASTDSTTTGSNASLASFTAGVVRLTNASLVSLANIPAGANGQQLIILNRIGTSFTILDSSGAIGTAANRIFTGTGLTVTVPSNASVQLVYDSTSQRWQLIGISGSSSGFSSVTVRARNGSAQSIPNNTLTTVTFPTENWDSANAFNASTGVFTAPIDGVYLVTGVISWNSNATGQRYGYVVQNGTLTGYFNNGAEQPGITGTVTMSFNDTCRVLAGQTISIQAIQTSGGNLVLGNSGVETYINIDRVGDY